MAKPLLIDLFCGLGGWAEGFLAEGWDVVGFDNQLHDYGSGVYPGQLVLQDARTLSGSQMRRVAGIVASPPCTEYSYMAMPWSRGKQIGAALRGAISPEGLPVPFPDEYDGSRTLGQLNELFDLCFRIRAEASAAAGWQIPMVVENVKGAQPWVGKAQANYGSYYLWGDIRRNGNRLFIGKPVFGGGLKAPRRMKVGRNFHQYAQTGIPSASFHGAPHEKSVQEAEQLRGVKQPGHVNRRDGHPHTTHLTAPAEGVKQGGTGAEWFDRGIANVSSSSPARKAESARIAKIPLELASFVAREWRKQIDNGA